MSVLILNYVPGSSSAPWATCGVLEARSEGIRLWLLAYSNVTIKNTLNYYKILRLEYIFKPPDVSLLILISSLS